MEQQTETGRRAVEMYQNVFSFVPSPFQQDLIEQTITDLVKWREVLIMWAGNDYRPQSVKKMLDYYDELGQAKKQGRFYDPGKSDSHQDYVPEPTCPKCGDICFGHFGETV